MFDFTKSKKKLNKEINELRRSLATKEALLVREGKKEGVFVLTTAERILVESELQRIRERNPRLAKSLNSVEGWKLLLQAKGGGLPSENDLYKALMAQDSEEWQKHTEEGFCNDDDCDGNNSDGSCNCVGNGNGDSGGDDDEESQGADVILSGTTNSSGVKSRADALRAGQLSADADTGAAILEIAAT